MKMNRYIITVLYVMAGCAVSVPLNAQHGTELFRGEHLRIIVSESVDGITIEHVSKIKKRCKFYSSQQCDRIQKQSEELIVSHYLNIESELKTTFQYHAHKIRAPEFFDNI